MGPAAAHQRVHDVRVGDEMVGENRQVGVVESGHGDADTRQVRPQPRGELLFMRADGKDKAAYAGGSRGSLLSRTLRDGSDYVIVTESARPRLVERLIEELPARASADSTRIVNRRHLDRLANALAGHGGHQIGGRVNVAKLTVSPALVTDPDLDSQLMREEIFGPILPLISVPTIDDAIDFVNDRPKPLALYVFTESRETERRVLENTSSGSVGINHMLYQLLVDELPFGGVGASGMGRYHGKHGFDTFSHHKAVLRKSTRPDPAVTYPPYGRAMQAILRRVMG